MAGPATPETCWRLMRQDTAFSKTDRGTSGGRIATRAGSATVTKMASRKRRRYIADTGAWCSEATARPTQAAAEPTALITMSARLLKASAR